MPIVWDAAFCLGEEAIDADHRAMMALIRVLEGVAARPGSGSAVEALLIQLRDLCLAHFTREEAFQRAIGFPDLDGPRLGHQMLLKRLDAVLAHFSSGSDQIRAGILRILADSLATWLAFHITRGGAAMRPYVEAARHRRRPRRRSSSPVPPQA